MVFIGRDGQTDGGPHQPFRFVGTDPGHDAISDLSGQEFLDPLLKGDDLAIGWKYGRDINQIAFFDPGIAQGQFKGLQFGLVSPDPFGEKDLLGNEEGIVQAVLSLGRFSFGGAQFFRPALKKFDYI